MMMFFLVSKLFQSSGVDSSRVHEHTVNLSLGVLLSLNSCANQASGLIVKHSRIVFAHQWKVEVLLE